MVTSLLTQSNLFILPGYNHVDYGYINTTNRFPFGKFQSEDGGDLTFESAKIGIRVRPITPGPTHRLAGEAGVFTLPIHFGEGYFRLAGESVVRIRAVYYGSGKFSNFGGSAEAISNVDSGRTVLFSVGGEALTKVRFVYIGTGSLFTFVSKTESTSVTEKPQVLHQFSGGAVEKNTESYVGTGSLFGFVSSTESTVVKSTSSGLFKIQWFWYREEYRELCWSRFSVRICFQDRIYCCSICPTGTIQIYRCNYKRACQVPSIWYWYILYIQWNCISRKSCIRL